MSLNPHMYQPANSSTSTLRPRTSRLISFLDDDGATTVNAAPLVGTSSTMHVSSLSSTSAPFPSRGVSPLPSLGRARSVAQNKGTVQANQMHTRSASEHTLTSPSTPNSLWESWSSIQGIASTLLGSDVQSGQKSRSITTGKMPAKKRPIKVPATSSSYGEWGPIVDVSENRSAVDSMEERQAKVQAKKREALLLTGADVGKDINGRYKRRDSNSDISRCFSGQEEDALVYVHNILPHDTLAGVTIKYSCQPEVFRRVNRFWPNDNIQTRHHVFLPVEACSVRGKKVVSSTLGHDLLSSDLETLNISNQASGSKDIQSGLSSHFDTAMSPLTHIPSSTSLVEDSKHESWIELPGFPKPVEIIRLPRHTLGYFPPARRKSITSPSVASTPRSSLDMLRHPPTHAASLNASPVRRPRPPSQTAKQRSSSITTPSFAGHLQGPGGVGTLRGLRTEASRPGPAEDPLNRKFKQYLPDLAPPEAFPRASLRPTPGGTPRASTDSIRSTSSAGLSDVSGAIEGWVRKMATPKANKMGHAKMGDLIELETNSDMGDLLGEGGGEQTPTAATIRDAQPTATEEALLNERFPMRGRVRTAYEGVGKDKGG